MKKLLSVLLVISLLLGSLSVAASAKADAADRINLKTARNIATLYLAMLEPVSPGEGRAPVKLGKDFTLLEERTFYNISEEAAFYNFNFESTADSTVKGYITVSINADLPFVMEQAFSPSPFDSKDIIKTYYISPLVYFNQMADGSYLAKDGKTASLGDIQNCFADYGQYRKSLYAQNSAVINDVKAENAAALSAVKTIQRSNLSKPLSWESINDWLLEVLNYYLGSIWHNMDIGQINASVENLIKEQAGEGYVMTYSSTVDKNYMIPQYQSYYERYVGGGICGKASSMMALAFYRDGKGYNNLPDDKTMYAELSAVYDEITQDYSFFFGNEFVSDEMDLSDSYLMLGTLDMGLAYYLYTKGYKEAARNVVDNARFSVTMVPDAVSNVLMHVLRLLMTSWLEEHTGGELTFLSNVKTNTNDVILNSLKQGEPVVIGCLTAIGCNWFSNHYFAGVGYYKMESVGQNGTNTFALTREYVEVYDTWGHDSSVVDWNVFKSTALYSSTSLAAV